VIATLTENARRPAVRIAEGAPRQRHVVAQNETFCAALGPVLRDATHWDEVVTQLGYEHPRGHDLRHAGLTWMADAGVPVHVLRKIAGHRSLVTTQCYLHPDAQSITDAGIALSAHLSARRSPNGLQLRLVKAAEDASSRQGNAR